MGVAAPAPRRRRPWDRWQTPRRRTWRSVWGGVSPSRLLVLSFASLVLIGTFGFRWLPGLAVEGPLSWVDALFMATSAVCVTGLAVIDPATELTGAGQLWMLLLVQLGGLGLLTFTSGILLTVGRRLSLRHETLVHTPDGVAPEVDYRALVRRVLRHTLLIELFGFILLYAVWAPRFGVSGALWPSAFHTVTAFANSGFSIFPGGLTGRAEEGSALVVVMMLAMLGGLGFLVLEELTRWVRHGRRRVRLSLHTRIVLATTVAVVVVGAAGIGALEWQGALAGLQRSDRVLNAIFGSAATRTAGFHTMDYALVSTPTALVMMALMFIGGAPGSTAGGVKVTTVALLVVLAAARLRGRRHVSMFHRTIPEETLGRATGLMVLATLVLPAGLLALVAADSRAASHDMFLPYMFEAVSAFSTAGASMNLTPELSPGARLVLVVLMFVGRVGIMTAAAALALGRHTIPLRYAKEDVAIG